MAAMESYRHVRAIRVRFADLDPYKHANNAAYLSYIETARLSYLREVLGRETIDDLNVIIANVVLDFRSPAEYEELIEVGARIASIGRTSYTMEHEIRGQDGRLVAEARTVLVAFDYARSAPMVFPDEWRERVAAYEARSFAPA